MNLANQILILTGFAVQICNIIIDIRFILFRRKSINSSSSRSNFLDILIFLMVSLFCVVYLIIFFLKLSSVWVGILLFTGAFFVTTMLLWIYTLIKESRNSAFNISKTLIGIVETRDPNLNGHSLHVQELSLLIYRHLPPSRRKLISEENLEYAALFHDVGKLGIPEAILNKPGKLDDAEWEIVRNHPRLSVKILKPIKAFDCIHKWILYHNERIDGNGYMKIQRKEIPVAARIISVADTYSAITMRRSYKPPKTYEEAVSILKEVRNTQLDADLVDLFCSIPKAEVEECMKHVIEVCEQNAIENLIK